MRTTIRSLSRGPWRRIKARTFWRRLTSKWSLSAN